MLHMNVCERSSGEATDRARDLIARIRRMASMIDKSGTAEADEVAANLAPALADVCDALIIKIERLRTVPEFRPLSVLTLEVAKRCSTWAFKYPEGRVPRNRDLKSAIPHASLATWPDYIAVFAADDPEVVTCRPIDHDGTPKLWSEVGL